MGAGAIGGSIGSILGGLIGNNVAQGDTDQKNQFAGQAYQDLINAGLPPDQAKAVLINQYKQAGTLTPQLEQSINAGPSAVQGISEDPQTRAAQMQALGLLQQRATGGLNPEDQAKFNQLRQQAQSDAQAKQAQIMQNYQQRGLGGGGAELAARLSGQQGSANQEASQGDQLAATASQNALQAALQSGNLGGQVRGQDFSNAMAKSQAQDMMNRFNTQNQVAQQQRNVASQNQAQAQNLANSQNISNANTNAANQELYRQQNAQEQYYQDMLNRAKVLSGADWAQSGRFAQNAQNTQNQYGQIGGALGQLGGMAASGASGDPSAGEAPIGLQNSGDTQGDWTGGGGVTSAKMY